MDVLNRDQNTFIARLEIHGQGVAHHIKEFKGSIKNGNVSWFAKDVTVIKGHEGHNHSGKIIGNRIELNYSGQTKTGGKPVRGTVILTRDSNN